MTEVAPVTVPTVNQHPLKEHEKIVNSIRAYGKSCYGCEKTGKDVMISISPVGSGLDIFDYFMGRHQAELFVKELTAALNTIYTEEEESDAAQETS